MTGEITLRGRVLPIGGVKEKMLAAYRAGIRTLLLPQENKKDLEDVPEHVRKVFDIILVDNIGDVLKVALLPKRKLTKAKAGTHGNKERKICYQYGAVWALYGHRPAADRRGG